MTVYLFTKMKEKMQDFFYPREEADDTFAQKNHTHNTSNQTNNTGWTPNKNLVTSSNGTIITEDKYSHPTSGVQPNTTPSLKKIAYDNKGHITQTTDINLNDFNIDLSDLDIDLTEYVKNSDLEGYVQNNISNQYVKIENLNQSLTNINQDINSLRNSIQSKPNLGTTYDTAARGDHGHSDYAFKSTVQSNYNYFEGYLKGGNVEWFGNHPLIDQQASWAMARSGWCFVNIYMHLVHPGDGYYPSPLDIGTVDLLPPALIETSAHLVIDNDTRYPATLQLDTTGFIRCYHPKNIKVGCGVYGTIVYPYVF